MHVCVHPEVPPARMWVLILPLGVPGCFEGSALFMNEAYWPNLWPWCSLSLFLFSPSVSLSLCPPAGAYCEPARLEKRAHSDWTKRHPHHWAALPTSPHSSLSLDAAGVCAQHVCVHVLTRRSNTSTCLSTTSSLSFALTYSPITPPHSSFFAPSFFLHRSFHLSPVILLFKAQGVVLEALCASW